VNPTTAVVVGEVLAPTPGILRVSPAGAKRIVSGERRGGTGSLAPGVARAGPSPGSPPCGDDQTRTV